MDMKEILERMFHSFFVILAVMCLPCMRRCLFLEIAS